MITMGRRRDRRKSRRPPAPRARASSTASTSRTTRRLVLARVADILRRISFGTVVLVVQDGKVVQIEMAEKFRLR